MKKNLILFVFCICFSKAYTFEGKFHIETPGGQLLCTYDSNLPSQPCVVTISLCDSLQLFMTHDYWPGINPIAYPNDLFPSLTLFDVTNLPASASTQYVVPHRTTLNEFLAFTPTAVGTYTIGTNSIYPIYIINVVPCTQECPTLTASSTSICSGQSVALTVQGGAPTYTVQPGNIVLTTGVPLLVTPPAGVTTYSIAATVDCPATSVNVTTSTTTPLTVAASSTLLCNSGPVVITATGLSPGANYTLYPNNITSNTGVFTVNPNVTTTYTIIGNDSNCCMVSGEITITVGEDIVPTFNQVASICTGGNLLPLPNTSLNGITGTWSPALNNTATTTYTFTPNAGQCATQTTMVIVVNNPVITVSASATTIVNGQSVILTPSGATNYILFPGNIVISGGSFIVSPSQTTTYTIIGSTDCCNGSTQLTINVN